MRANEKLELLDYERYKELIDEISKYPIVRLTLFINNEPLLDKRITNFIEYAYKKLPNIYDIWHSKKMKEIQNYVSKKL